MKIYSEVYNIDNHAEILREIGEWMALGWYEGLAMPWPRSYGLAFRRLYENMAITIPDNRLLLPHEPFENARTMESHGVWHATNYILDFNHSYNLTINPDIVKEKKELFPHHADFIDALQRDLQRQIVNFGGYTHSNPDIRRVVNDGFLCMLEELDAEIAAGQKDDSPDEAEAMQLLLTLRDYTNGVLAFHRKAVDAMKIAASEAIGERKEKLTIIADSFAKCFLHPATNFIESLLAINFTWMLDGCDSLGRIDQALGVLFENDLKNGTLDIELSRQLIDEMWQNFERYNGWNIQIGGYTPDGKDGVNKLTLELIDACRRNHLRRPNVAFRITKSTPDDVLMTTLKALRDGSGRPALYNDDLYVDTLYKMDLGLTQEDAREIGFGGCTETMITGLSNVGSLEGDLNLAKALELAIYDGFNPISKHQQGPHTGNFADYSTFDDFLKAVKRQIEFMTDSFVAFSKQNLAKRFHHGDPKIPRTFFTRDCVKNRKSFEAGGARYNWSVISYQGIANLIDSLSAIRKLVFDEQTISKQQLIDALTADFVGCDEIHRQLANAPKFGNDNSDVDSIAADIINFTWDTLYAHETPRGGRYLASCILFTTYLGAGMAVGATPDGRKAHEPLTDSVGPMWGRDTNGPTAMLHSVTNLPLYKAVGTPVLNMRIQQSLLRDDAGLRAATALIRTYFAQGGMQLQISVVNKEEMVAAQREPEKYRDLIVRIGGYSEYFTRLPKELQDTVIARTEYTL
ncbi:MAG: pyruvate formate lyase family protein [bacterium]